MNEQGALYKLRCSLLGHSKDVRCVISGDFAGEECIVTGSRDKTAKLWCPEGNGYTCNQTFGGNEGYISSVTTIVPSSSFSSGAILTGCQDGKIRIYNPASQSPLLTIPGHSDTVCALAAKSEFFLSGSWDKSAKVWRYDGSSVVSLAGHSAAVWTVEVIESSCPPNEALLLTGSADKTIKLWKGQANLATYEGHTDCVRALAVCDDRTCFLSAANDATIRLWQVASGECLSVFYGHTNYIYSLSKIPNSPLFASCGEDRSLRLWSLENKNECIQTIHLPAQSVWSVSNLKNGDIVTGSSDGIVRVFTCAAERTAPPELLQAFEEELAATSLNANLELGGIKASELPGPESLFEPGTKEGQTKIVRSGDTISCYSWSTQEKQWTKVGDVVGAAGQSDSTKTLHDGKEYDYVFTVDIEEGKPPLKLPYNATEDPWHAAQKFIHQNNLSQYYLDTVANFIINNTKSAGVSGPSANQTSGQTFADPFTGGSRYVPANEVATPANANSQPCDPFTGGGRYVPKEAAQPTPSLEYFPNKDFIRFEQANLEGIKKKLQEFNDNVLPELKFSSSEFTQFMDYSNPHEAVSRKQLLEKVFNWPTECLFPVLDVIRIAARSQHADKLFASDLFKKLLNLIPSSVPNCMIIYRTIANLISHAKLQQIAIENQEVILGSMETILKATDTSLMKHSQWKNVEIGISTVILNYSTMMHSTKQHDLNLASNLLRTVKSIILLIKEDEALFRILVAVGTLLADDDCIALASSLDLGSCLAFLHEGSERVKSCYEKLSKKLI